MVEKAQQTIQLDDKLVDPLGRLLTDPRFVARFTVFFGRGVLDDDEKLMHDVTFEYKATQADSMLFLAFIQALTVSKLTQVPLPEPKN